MVCTVHQARVWEIDWGMSKMQKIYRLGHTSWQICAILLVLLTLEQSWFQSCQTVKCTAKSTYCFAIVHCILKVLYLATVLDLWPILVKSPQLHQIGFVLRHSNLAMYKLEQGLCVALHYPRGFANHNLMHKKNLLHAYKTSAPCHVRARVLYHNSVGQMCQSSLYLLH